VNQFRLKTLLTSQTLFNHTKKNLALEQEALARFQNKEENLLAELLREKPKERRETLAEYFFPSGATIKQACGRNFY